MHGVTDTVPSTQAVKACGKHWREVAKHVPTRSDKQCRERWANVLDPELRLYAEWTPEEDALLLRAVKECTQPNGKVKCAHRQLSSMRGVRLCLSCLDYRCSVERQD